MRRVTLKPTWTHGGIVRTGRACSQGCRFVSDRRVPKPQPSRPADYDVDEPETLPPLTPEDLY